jgi:hypothetical protein
MSATSKSLAVVVRNMRRAGRTMESALGDAIHQEALAIMAQSKQEVPVDTGRLRQTGYVAKPRPTVRGPMVSMGYGTRYALPVHERLEVRHPVGKAKFLEDPVNAAKQGYTDRVARRAWANFKRGRMGGSTPGEG